MLSPIQSIFWSPCTSKNVSLPHFYPKCAFEIWYSLRTPNILWCTYLTIEKVSLISKQTLGSKRHHFIHLYILTGPWYIVDTIHSYICTFTNSFIYTHPSIHLLIHPPTYPLVHSTIYSSIYPPTYPSIHQFIHLPTHPYIHPSTHPSTYPPVHLSTHSSIYPPTHLLIYPSTHPPIHPTNISECPQCPSHFSRLWI